MTLARLFKFIKTRPTIARARWKSAIGSARASASCEARRNYGLSENQGESSSLNLNVLSGRGRTLIAIESQPDAVNTTSTIDSLRGKTVDCESATDNPSE